MTAPIVVADTSVLINFLKIDRMDLIGRHLGRFLATDHVESELAVDYPDQRARYQAAVGTNLLDTCSVTDPAEVELFLRLGPGVRLGAGNVRQSLLHFLVAMQLPLMTVVRLERPSGRRS